MYYQRDKHRVHLTTVQLTLLLGLAMFVGVAIGGCLILALVPASGMSQTGGDGELMADRSVTRQQLMAALNTTRSYVSSINTELEALETYRKRQIIQRDAYISNGGDPESVQCRNLLKRAGEWQDKIDEKIPLKQRALAVEKDLQSTVSEIEAHPVLVGGGGMVTDDKAYKAFKDFMVLAKLAGLERELEEKLNGLQREEVDWESETRSGRPAAQPVPKKKPEVVGFELSE